MSEGDEPTRWCPNCGAEYRWSYTECADCHVRLVNEQPPPPPVEDVEFVDHSEIAYDLTDWDPDKRRSIEFLLSSARIAYVWDKGLLYVSHAHQDAVDDMVDTLEDPEGFDEEEPDVGGIEDGVAASGAHEDAGEHIAGPGRRLLGALVDVAVNTFVSWMVLLVFGRGSYSTHRTFSALRFSVLAINVYLVSAVALWGQTLGKLAAGTRVVAFDDGSRPGWRRSIIRWVVPAAPTLLLIPVRQSHVALWAPVTLGWMIVVYVGVLTDRYRRGLHDRAAGTIVIDTDYRRPRRSAIMERLPRGQRLG